MKPIFWTTRGHEAKDFKFFYIFYEGTFSSQNHTSKNLGILEDETLLTNLQRRQI